MSGTSLIVHRSEDFLERLTLLLAPLDMMVASASLKALPRSLGDSPLELVIAEFDQDSARMLELLRDLRSRQPGCAVVAVADARGANEAIEALADCVDDYVLAPPEPADFRARCRRVLLARGLHRRLELLQQELNRRYGAHRIVCRSSAMEQVYARVLQLAPTKTTCLITGDSGSGKELIARSLHYNSARRDQPFVPMNCGSVTETLIESELFGHQRGAFTGAVETVAGKFELANGGTLFLDEVGSMPLGVQSRFLRVLEQGEFMRVGGTKTIRVDVRVVAATNTDLEQQVKEKEFRRDLLYRLKVATIEVPPLRKRIDDIPVLARTFVKQLCEENHVPVKDLSPEAIHVLCRHDWPGNVRELKNLLESLIVTVSERVILPEHLPDSLRAQGQPPGSGAASHASGPPPFPRDVGPADDRSVLRAGMTLAQAEQELIRLTLVAHDGNRSRAARALGIGLRTLQRRIKELAIDVPVGVRA